MENLQTQSAGQAYQGNAVPSHNVDIGDFEGKDVAVIENQALDVFGDYNADQSDTTATNSSTQRTDAVDQVGTSGINNSDSANEARPIQSRDVADGRGEIPYFWKAVGAVSYIVLLCIGMGMPIGVAIRLLIFGVLMIALGEIGS